MNRSNQMSEKGAMSVGLGNNFNLLELCVNVADSGTACSALIDSGATHNFVSAALVK